MQNIERKELQVILESPGFCRTWKLREALQYLCEWHWAEKEQAPTQYDLAQKLYGSEAEAEINARNLVMRLRTKLNEFYEINGKVNGLRLGIPKGEYRVVFDRINPGMDDPESNTPNGVPYTTSARVGPWRIAANPGRMRFLLVSLLAVVVLACSIFWWLPPGQSVNNPNDSEANGVTADSVIFQDSKVIGVGPHGGIVWEEDLGGLIDRRAELAVPAGVPRRYIVTFGGRLSEGSPAGWVSPQVVIINEVGIIEMGPVDLLSRFNPFEDKYDEKLFLIEYLGSADLDNDEYGEGILRCRHQWYPDILYIISGSKLDVDGAYANSGRMHGHWIGARIGKGGLGRSHYPIVVMGTNNRMGFQNVVFVVQLGEFQVSPDLLDAESSGFTRVKSSEERYRPLGNVRFKDVQFGITETGSYQLKTEDDKSIIFNNSCWLETDRWYSSDTAPNRYRSDHITNQACRRYGKLYSQVRGAEGLVIAGYINKGRDAFNDALNTLDEIGLGNDYPLKHYVRSKAISVLIQAGNPEMTLGFLPTTEDEIIHPGRLALQKGTIRFILNRSGVLDELEQSFDTDNEIGVCELYVSARLLAGHPVSEIFRGLQQLSPEFVHTNPIWRSWLLIPGLLRGEAGLSRAEAESITYPPYDLPGQTLEYQNFPHQREIWNGLVDIELGNVPDWPDEDRPLIAEGSQREMVDARLEMLKAVRMHATGKDQGLDMLGRSYVRLKELSLREVTAIIPLVYVAYKYGFAATEAGEHKAGAEALELALARYGWGENADRARSLLRE